MKFLLHLTLFVKEFWEVEQNNKTRTIQCESVTREGLGGGDPTIDHLWGTFPVSSISQLYYRMTYSPTTWEGVDKGILMRHRRFLRRWVFNCTVQKVGPRTFLNEDGNPEYRQDYLHTSTLRFILVKLTVTTRKLSDDLDIKLYCPHQTSTIS